MSTTTTHIKIDKQLVPALRFNEFDGDIEETLFGNHYSFYTTNSLSRDKLNYENGEVRNIHYGDIHTKFQTHFHLTNEYVPFINDDVDLVKIKEDSYCKVGDLVIADASEDYADIGKSIELIDINNEKLLAGLHTFLARPSSDETAVGYISYLLKSWKLRKQIMTIAQGTKVLSLSSGRVSKLKLNLPTLPEQQKIASFLSAVDEKIQQLTKKKALLEDYKKGVMQQLFSGQIRFKDENGNDYPQWEEKRLGEITKYVKGFAFKSTDYQDFGVRIVRVSDLLSNSIKKDNDKVFIDEEKSKLYDKYSLKKGNIIITTVGSKPEMIESAVGRGIYIYNDNEGLLNQNMLKFENIKSVSNGFLIGLINTKRYQHYMKDIARGNANQANITVKDLMQYVISLPSFEEQQKIATCFSSIDVKIESVNQQITQTQTFKKGLLQQMFVAA